MNKKLLKYQSLLIIVAITTTLISIFLIASYHQFNLDYLPYNGAFQSFNPVRRILLGEIPGQHFNPYLGLGPTYLNYFFTSWFGKNFAASQFSIYFLSLLLHYLVLLILLRLVEVKLELSIVIASTSLILLTFVFQEYYFVNEIVGPGNSNLNFRFFLSFLTSLIVFLILKNWPQSILTYFSLGILTGVQIFWSNDYGIPSTINLLILIFIWLFTVDKQKVITKLIITLTGAIVSFYSGGNLFTGNSLQLWLRNNFTGVANDQFWYFFWFTGNNKLFSLSSFTKHLYLIGFIVISCLALGVIWHQGYQKKHKISYLLLGYLSGNTMMAGLLSSFGGTLSIRYFLPSVFVSFFTIYLAIKLLYLQSLSLVKLSKSATKIILVILLCFYGYSLTINYQHTIIKAKQEKTEFIKVPELGGWLPPKWQETVNIARYLGEELKDKPVNQRILSTYSSSLDAIANSFNSTGIDYIIHALGSESRQQYLESFAKMQPEYITTLREDYTPWETWAIRSNWWFYREFLLDYQLVEVTFYNLIWKKKLESINHNYPAVTCQITQKQNNLIQLTLDTSLNLQENPDIYYLDLSLNYDLNFPQLFKPRGLVNVIEVNTPQNKDIGIPGNHSYGIPPTHENWHIPVEHKIGTPAIIYLKAYPENSAQLRVKSCEAKIMIPATAFSLSGN